MQRDAAIIRVARKSLGLKQKDLASQLGYSSATIYRLESGSPQVQRDKWARVAELVGVGFDWPTGRVLPSDATPPEAVDREIMEMEAEASKPGPKSHDLDNARAVVAWMREVAAGGDEEGLVKALAAAFAGKQATAPASTATGRLISAGTPAAPGNSRRTAPPADGLDHAAGGVIDRQAGKIVQAPRPR